MDETDGSPGRSAPERRDQEHLTTRNNALAESFFASLKGELIDTRPWPTRATARRAVVDYIGWYNGTRLHSTLGYLSPAEFESAAGKEDLGQVA
jgi:transposase InsO family protein